MEQDLRRDRREHSHRHDPGTMENTPRTTPALASDQPLIVPTLPKITVRLSTPVPNRTPAPSNSIQNCVRYAIIDRTE